MMAHLTWAKGGTATLLVIRDDAVTLRSSIPSPPGSRLEATLVSDTAVGVKVKIHGSKLESDGSFTLRGKLLEATRELRARLAALVPGALSS
jgi:hypothetical protein